MILFQDIKPISLTLLVLLSLTSVVPAAQASELDNALVEPAPSQYYLSGLWLVLIYPEYIDIHLWYQFSDAPVGGGESTTTGSRPVHFSIFQSREDTEGMVAAL